MLKTRPQAPYGAAHDRLMSCLGKESACNTGDPGSILGLEDPLEEGMATHSSILAWRIPQTEELGRSPGVGHD